MLYCVCLLSYLLTMSNKKYVNGYIKRTCACPYENCSDVWKSYAESKRTFEASFILLPRSSKPNTDRGKRITQFRERTLSRLYAQGDKSYKDHLYKTQVFISSYHYPSEFLTHDKNGKVASSPVGGY